MFPRKKMTDDDERSVLEVACAAGMKTPKRRPGRPPRDTAAGPAHYHLGLRFPNAERDQLLALRQHFNQQLEVLGLSPTVTVSSMVKRWINERLRAEIEKNLMGEKKKGHTWSK